MIRGKSFIVFFVVMSVVFGASAQRYFTGIDVGIGLGGSQYFGDLNDHYGLKTIGPAGGVYVRQRMNAYIAVKAVANYTKIGYDDKYNTDPYQKQRNLNFQTGIFEVALQAEFNFFKYITGDPQYRFTPFLTGGVGVFYYDPYTTYNGVKYYLRPLGTEGQKAGFKGRKYDNMSACFPLGLGFKYWLKGGVNLTLEFADRLTTTDYIDDVSTTYVGRKRFASNSIALALQDRSQEIAGTEMLGREGKQRGNSSSFDQYFMAMLSISFNFTSYRCPSFMRMDDDMRVR
jgi:Domain of unknown function (DUF6089)